MTSEIQYQLIDDTFPIAGRDNPSQGFRDNFGRIKVNLQIASTEITTLQNDSALKTELLDEVTRATTAELDLAQQLSNEVARASDIEYTLQATLDDEISRAQNIEEYLRYDIDDEITRASTVDASITSSLNHEASRAIAAESQLSQRIDNNTTSITQLTTNLNSEVLRASEIEATIQSNVSFIDVRLTLAEESILNEVTRATTIDAELLLSIQNEISRATSSESTNAASIADEITRALAAEASLSAAITGFYGVFKYVSTVSGGTEINPVDLRQYALAFGGLSTGNYYKVTVAGWVSDGVGSPFYVNVGDGLVWNTTLRLDKIDNTDSTVNGTTGFITVSGSTDQGYLVDIDQSFKTTVTNINSNLNDEITRATTIEGSIQSSIAAESTRLSNTIGELYSETSRAISVENGLSNSIDVETTRINTLISNLDIETTRAINVDATLTSSLNIEITRAINAESTIAANVLIEKTRAINAESTIQTALTNEISRAQAAESSITIAANGYAKLDVDNTGRALSNIVVSNKVAAERTINTTSGIIDYADGNYQKFNIASDCTLYLDNWPIDLYSKIRLEFRNSNVVTDVQGTHDTEAVITFASGEAGTVKSGPGLLPLFLPQERNITTIVDVWTTDYGVTVFTQLIGYYA